MRSRRGFTIVELLVVLLLLGLVTGSLYALLNNTQRVSRAQSERIDMQSNMRLGALFLPAELREVGYDTSAVAGTVTPDILGMGQDSIAFRAVRASGVICNVSGGRVVIDTAFNYAQLTAPAANMTLDVFAERADTLVSDDSWETYTITNVTSGTCSGSYMYGARSGIRIDATGVPAAGVLVLGSPFRVLESVVYRIYSSGGQYWLGTRSITAGGSIQPILGPLFSDSGFQVTYLDKAGAVTTTPNNVRTLQIKLRALASQRIDLAGKGSGQQTVDSLVTDVELRNAARP
jgi:prepilin-type N-terminal cleavage/methylation domain-containing protein